MRTYYDVLGVGPDATQAEIKDAYRTRAKLLHPDRHAESSPEERSHATVMFAELNAARETLLDPEKRERYDTQLAQDQAGSGGPGGIPRGVAADTVAGIIEELLELLLAQQYGSIADVPEEVAAVLVAITEEARYHAEYSEHTKLDRSLSPDEAGTLASYNSWTLALRSVEEDWSEASLEDQPFSMAVAHPVAELIDPMNQLLRSGLKLRSAAKALEPVDADLWPAGKMAGPKPPPKTAPNPQPKTASWGTVLMLGTASVVLFNLGADATPDALASFLLFCGVLTGVLTGTLALHRQAVKRTS